MVNGIQVVLESARLLRIRFPFDHRSENRFQEPVVRFQTRSIANGKRGLGIGRNLDSNAQARLMLETGVLF